MDNARGIEAKIRYYQSHMFHSGRGLIAFGVWTILKLVLDVFYNPERLQLDLVAESVGEENISAIIAVVSAIVGTVILLDMLLRGYIGFSAVAESRGVKKRSTYLIVCTVYTIVSLINDIRFVLDRESWVDYVETFTTVTVDLSSILAGTIIIYSAIRTRQLQKKLMEL